MFKKVLIANRGVVAVRVARTLRKLGVSWVAVYSKADADLPYVKEADEAYLLGPAPARESYLKVDALIDVIRKSGCDAVHPGYGFLSEDPEFARKVSEAGAVFIGPGAKHIEAMGHKVRAREHMAKANIPVLPASLAIPEGQTDYAEQLSAIRMPMLVKAAAGGGGIGMQRVYDENALISAIDKTRQLSARAFGDGTVYLERYIEEPRHIEFQMVGDGHGNVRNIFERDCSIQRRHQKVVEESPAPALDREECMNMAELLVNALKDWNYDSLGTVEMLLDRDGNYYFLETNTRLQVEHGVTEAVTGLDLVEVQVRIAAGETLDEILPPRIEQQGHAIEMRIYAEDPVRFFPSVGGLSRFDVPDVDGVHTETHLVEGATVTPNYDPMLALVIAKGADRSDALKRAYDALANFKIEGVKTNIPFLMKLLTSEVFREVRHHTTLAEEMSKSVA